MAEAKVPSPITKVIDQWNGRLTRFRDGDMNSGLANYYTSWGYDCFEFNGTLTFSQGTVDITKSVITDLVMCGKVRIESGITYMYCLGHTGRIYKIQVNNTSTKNPDYDTPVLLATLANSQTFKFGASLDFYKAASTERIWIGHDAGITFINFDGTSETNFTSASIISNVPRQQTQFAGKNYFTNGSNLMVVDSSETISNYNVLSPGFPSNSTARDIRTTADGRYIVAVVTRNPPGDNTLVTPNTSEIAAMPSYLFYWNGIDVAPSSYTSFPSFSLNTYYSFSNFEYLFGYNVAGMSFGTTQNVVFLPEFEIAPHPNAIGSSGDFMSWASVIFNQNTGSQSACVDLYGTIDAETSVGMYRQIIQSSTLSGGDVVRIPFYAAVSSAISAGNSAGYFNASTNPLGQYGNGKTYFSTLEYNGSSTKYGFWMFKNVQDFTTAANTGVYETQHEVFSKKKRCTEYRVYIEPVLINNLTSFKIDLVDIAGNVISGTTQTFSPTTTSGDMLQYNLPNGHAPVAAMGVRITNIGSVSPFIHKIELDLVEQGK